MADTIVRLVMTTQGVKEGAREFQNFEKTSTRAMSSAEVSVASSLGKIAAQYLSLGVAIRKSMKAMSSGVEFNKFVETQTMAFSVMMKSAEKAKAQMKDLYDFAVSSPLTFKETAGSAKQLMAYGFTAKELIPTMERLGTVALATGHDLGDIAYVYGTLKSQGRAYSRDLMQFGMRGIPIYEELASVMGVTADKIQKMASEGKIGFKEVEKAFMNMTTGSGRFAGTIDGYMETLTGKMSMLGDIVERTLGSLMSNTTNAMKNSIDGIIRTLESSGFQNAIQQIGTEIGILASTMLSVGDALLKLLPVLSAFVKLWITFKALQIAKNVLGPLPNTLFKIGENLINASIQLSAFTTAGAFGLTSLSAGFSNAVLGIKALSAELLAFTIANPWVLAIAGGVAAMGVAVSIAKNAASNRTSTSEDVRADQLAKDYKNTASATSAGSGMTRFGYNLVKPSDVAAIAKEYDLAEDKVAAILIQQNALDDALYRAYINAKNVKAELDLEKQMQELMRGYKSVEEIQMDYFANVTGLAPEAFADPDDWTAKGYKAAQIYVSSLKEATQTQASILGSALLPSDTEAFLKTELDSLLSELMSAGANLPEAERSGYLRGLRERIIAVRLEMEGLSGSVKKTADDIKDLGTWWEPIIQATKLTETAVDDITVSFAKQAEEVDKEAEARKANLMLQYLATTDAEEQANIQMRISGIEALRIQYQQNITKEMEKQIELAKIQEEAAKFDKMVGGDSTYFDKLKGDIFASREAGKNGGATFSGTMGMLGDTAKLATQGTEVGSMLSGGDPVMMLIMSLAEAAASIENVSKLLNPIGTFLDAMFAILEPFINSALKPFVDWIEMLGEIVAKIIAPFISVIQIMQSFTYILSTAIMFPLQLLGAAFVWLNDTVIAPFGNKMIDTINAVIRVMNKIPGVSIRYLDNINLLSNATASLADRMNLAKDSLSASIDYLSDKINSVADKELDTLQELYEVGVFTGAEYEQRQKALTRVESDNLNVPDAYKNLTDVGEMLKSLTLLAEGQLEIANLGDKATPESIKAILNNLGIVYNEKSQEQLFRDAMLKALKDYDASNNSTLNNLSKGGGVDKKGHWESTGTEGWKWVPTTYLPTYTEEVAHTFQEALDAYNAASTQASKDDWAKILIDTAMANTTLTEEQIRNALGIPLASSSSRNIQAPVYIPSSTNQGSGHWYIPSSTNQGSGQNVNVYVNVQGSVTTEDDLARTIAYNINNQRRLGTLTV